MAKGEQVVVFGGTFDPVHNGHLIVARALAEAGGFRRVTLMPTGTPPHKAPPVAAPADRLEMLRMAAAGEDLFEVDELELNRRGPSYTIETIAELRRRRGDDVEIVWVIGADMLADLPRWRRIAEVLDAARIVVAVRPPWDQRLDSLFRELSASLSREVGFFEQAVVRTPLVDISSTDIRNRAAGRRSIRYLVPDTVMSYIYRRGLYGASSDNAEDR